MNKINLVREAIKETKGCIFSVDFIKKDKTLRNMQARIDVTAPLKGGVNTTAHIDKYYTVYDMKIQQYRNVNLEAVKRLKCGKIEHNFD